MNTFKKGDVIKSWDGVHRVVTYTSGPYVYYGDGLSSHYENCTLVTPKPKFGPGDVVHNSFLEPHLTIKCVRTTNHDGTPYTGPLAYNYVCDSGFDYDLESSLTLVRRFPTLDDVKTELKAGRKIKAINNYRTIYGVGLKEAKDAVEAMEFECGQTLGDILAAALKPKYKIGDRVELFGQDYVRDHGTVTKVDGENNRLTADWDDGDGNFCWYRFDIVRPSTKPKLGPVPAWARGPQAIVSRVESNGRYSPNENPRIHESQADAIKEAERLAKKEPGVSFAVFVLAGTSTATKPVAPTVTTVLV